MKVLSSYGKYERERDRVSKYCVIFFNKRIANTFVQNENAVPKLMFYNDSVFSNIHTACGHKLLLWHNVTTVLERVCSQTQLCQLRSLMTLLDNYMFRPLLAIFRVSLRELEFLLYNVRTRDGEISTSGLRNS